MQFGVTQVYPRIFVVQASADKADDKNSSASQGKVFDFKQFLKNVDRTSIVVIDNYVFVAEGRL